MCSFCLHAQTNTCSSDRKLPLWAVIFHIPRSGVGQVTDVCVCVCVYVCLSVCASVLCVLCVHSALFPRPATLSICTQVCERTSHVHVCVCSSHKTLSPQKTHLLFPHCVRSCLESCPIHPSLDPPCSFSSAGASAALAFMH